MAALLDKGTYARRTQGIFCGLFFLIVQFAVAVAFEIRVGDLRLEFLADALVFGLAFQTARTVAAGALQTLADALDDRAVLIETNLSHSILLIRITAWKCAQAAPPERRWRRCRAGFSQNRS